MTSGRYDSLASCAADAALEQILPAPLQTAMSFRCYEGGHMFYRDAASRLRFSTDIANFVR
ncbi:hypothetical protein [Brevundimonas sp.]|uniref:hypothetical protein n=1 Tax=Brevundimonas sp. TaxID=1871086 RepID=UPI0037BEDCA5